MEPILTELVVIDVRGIEHALRCPHGIDMDVNENGALLAVTRPPARRMTMVFAPWQWSLYREMYAERGEWITEGME